MNDERWALDRILDWPLTAARWVVVAVFAGMIAVTFLQVVFRYALTAPLPWSEEAARYCFVWIVFLGAALGLERGFHLGVDLLVNRMPPSLRRHVELVSNILIAGFAIVIIYASLPVLELNSLQRSPAIGVQMTWIYLAIPASMVLILLITLVRMVKRLAGRQG